jgi:hypothetical protein
LARGVSGLSARRNGGHRESRRAYATLRHNGILVGAATIEEMPAPLVDLVIPVHSASRPVARAVASVVEGTAAPVRVSVVAHNIDPAVISANLGAHAAHPAVRLLALADGIASPAGPMNHGLDRAEAPCVSVMGSDDELAPGAIDSWLRLRAQTSATAIIARVDILGRGMDPYPPVRNGRRTRDLDARKDRLAYRSAPLGLVDRGRFGHVRFTEGLASGEDLAYSAEVWFTGRTAYDRTGPAYLVHDDAGDRVTFSPRSVAEDFAFLAAIETATWFTSLATAERRALAIKILRVHFFDAVLLRLRSPGGIAAHAADLGAIVARLEAIAPGVVALLARVDRRVIDAVTSDRPDPEQILALLGARWNYRSAGALMTRNPLLSLSRQAPLRTLYAGLRSTTGV